MLIERGRGTGPQKPRQPLILVPNPAEPILDLEDEENDDDSSRSREVFL